jgi:hypothetical protein
MKRIPLWSQLGSFKVTITTVAIILTILVMMPILSIQQQQQQQQQQQVPFVNAQEQPQQQSVSGIGQGILPGDVPTLFSFKAAKDKDGKVSGTFECFAVMPDGKTMYVNSTVTSLTIAANGTSATLSGPTIVTGFGAGSGTFKAIAITPGVATGSNNTASNNGKLILTTDINRDGIQGNMPDGSEGPFNEKIMKASIRITP